MPIEEIALAAIADAVFGYLIDKYFDKLGNWASSKGGRNAKKRAFREALGEVLEQFEKQYPEWAASLFDGSFLKNEGAPILAQFLIRDGHPDPSELATHWADSLNIYQPERRIFHMNELKPAAADFLYTLSHQLKTKTELQELNDSRTFEQMAEALNALRQQFGAEKATFSTRNNYLLWLKEQYLYLDSRGTLQTYRHVQVKLEDVHITLYVQRDEVPGQVDRPPSRQERTEEAERWGEQSPSPYEVIELAEAATHYDHLVILGDPGCGKSTLLQYLALKHAEALLAGKTDAGRTDTGTDLGTPRFPVLVRIAAYVEYGLPQGKSLSDFLVDYCRLHNCPPLGLADLLSTELAAGNCLILFDGLDDVASTNDRSKTVEQLEEFARRYRHNTRPNRFIITSRIADYRSAALSKSFVHYRMLEMDNKQIPHFLQRWCLAVEAVHTPELSVQTREAAARREVNSLMKAIQTSPGAHQLATNPLLLRILAILHRAGTQLPQKRIDLYNKAAETLARTWREAKGIPKTPLLEDSFLVPLLGNLANWLHSNKPTGLATEQEVYDILGQKWVDLNELPYGKENPKVKSEVEKFLLAVRKETGLFVERALNQFGFMHPTFEEYYAALSLVLPTKGRARRIYERRYDSHWDEPILLALGYIGLISSEDAAELVETAILAQGEEARDLRFSQGPHESDLGWDYLFALRCLGDQIPLRPKRMWQFAERLEEELLYLKGSARFQRYQQVLRERLEHLRDSAIAPRLSLSFVEALRTSDETVRLRAAESLGRLGQVSDKVINALFDALCTDTERVSAQVAGSLIQLSQVSDEAEDALLKALQKYDKFWVRHRAAESLGQLRQASNKVIDALLNTLRTDDRVWVRHAAAESLGQLGQASDEVINAMLAALGSGDVGVRRAAAESLGQLGQASDEVINAMLAALEPGDVGVRRAAAESLGQLGQASDEVINAMLAALEPGDAEVRRAAAESLGQLGQASDRAIAALLSLINTLQTADAGVCRAATESLRRLGAEADTVVDALLNALDNDDPWIRRQVVESLGQLGQASDRVIAALLKASRANEDIRVRPVALESLGRLGQASDEVITALLNASCVGEDNRVRRAAAESLRQLGAGADTVVDALLNALDNPNPKLRLAAVQSLVRLEKASESDKVVPILINLLTDRDRYVCYQAAESLGRLESSGQLEQISNQEFDEMLNKLLEALRNTGNPQVLRRNAARLLGRIGPVGEQTSYALLRGLLDPDGEVRTACANGLAVLGKRSPDPEKEEVAKKLKHAMADAEFNVLDSAAERSAQDYAFDGLWLLELKDSRRPSRRTVPLAIP